ncbi:MAG TPA: GNAT family N-acetyltransferase [Actinomycetota bacterium]
MRRALPNDYELDDDRGRVDVDVVHRYLTASYWAEGRTRETVTSLMARAAAVIGVYLDDVMVGFCRIESDEVTYAFLLDVFVLEGHRGKGLGVELVRQAVEMGPYADLPWHLATRDAHELYERFGFGPPDLTRQMMKKGTRRT